MSPIDEQILDTSSHASNSTSTSTSSSSTTTTTTTTSSARFCANCGKEASQYCPECLKCKYPGEYVSVCTQECFKSRYKTHKLTHTTPSHPIERLYKSFNRMLPSDG